MCQKETIGSDAKRHVLPREGMYENGMNGAKTGTEK